MSTTVLTFWMLAMIICVAIGQRKNMGIGTCLLIGLFLGFIGVIVIACMSPEAPKGMYATKCHRCTALQNVPTGQAEYTCWQCHTPQHVTKGVLS